METTVNRVPQHTAAHVNTAIQEATEANVDCYSVSDALIDQRLETLKQEWDIERTLEANAAIAVLASVGLGLFVSRRLQFLPAVIAGFLLQHALQGWCPPVPVFRRLGFRTQPEIDEERFALKALRGDFNTLTRSEDTRGVDQVKLALAAVRR